MAEGVRGVGKVCFRCKGKGRIDNPRRADPYRVRYSMVDRLLPLVKAGNTQAIQKLERQNKNSLYWPVLEDVFTRALLAAEKVSGA